VIPRLLLCLLLLTGCSGLSAPEPEGPLTGDRLVEALQDGGLVLFVRHTETTADGEDDLSRPEQCEGQRSLTEQGRQQARDLGRAFEQLEIPVGRVVASPICRTAETARLAFGRTETDRALLPAEDAPPTEEQVAAGRALLADEPAEGENTVLVGHISSIRALAGAEPEEGGTVVFRPDGDAFLIVGEVPPGGWPRLAERR
jgi:broad specificity phosphatase PhoE